MLRKAVALTFAWAVAAQGEESGLRQVTTDAGGTPIFVAPTAYGPDVLEVSGSGPGGIIQVDCGQRTYREAEWEERLNQYGNRWRHPEPRSVPAAIVSDHCAAHPGRSPGRARNIPEFVSPEKTHVLLVCTPDAACTARGGPVVSCDAAVQHPPDLPSGVSAQCLPLTDRSALRALGVHPDGIVVRARLSRTFPRTDDYYPPAAVRHGEQGDVVLRACVYDSILIKDPVVVRSSGSENLDDGALALARAGDGRYLPALDLHGMPVKSCFVFRVRFMYR
jgi:hypothetical protein